MSDCSLDVSSRYHWSRQIVQVWWLLPVCPQNLPTSCCQSVARIWRSQSGWVLWTQKLCTLASKHPAETCQKNKNNCKTYHHNQYCFQESFFWVNQYLHIRDSGHTASNRAKHCCQSKKSSHGHSHTTCTMISKASTQYFVDQMHVSNYLALAPEV